MGIRDWFRRDPAPAARPDLAPGDRRFPLDRSRMFDIERTAMLGALFDVPRDQRAGDWFARFWDVAWTASIELAEPQTFHGPDGFPYLRLNVPRPRTPFDSQCLANLAGNCLDAGVGAAFFASPDDPPEAADYVLSLGVIDSLLRYDSPDGDPVDEQESRLPEDENAFLVERRDGVETLTTRQEHGVMVGTPSSDYLPPALARSLYQHLTGGWGMDEPRVSLMIDTHMRPHRSLVIGRKRSEFPDEALIDDMVRALHWHLDPGRMLMLEPEHWSRPEMTPLRELFEGR